MKRLFGTIVSVLALFILFTGKANASSDIELSTNRESPTTSQYVNLTIETDDDYTGKLTFSAKFRSSSSSSWTTISNLTSSTYFSDYSDDWDNGYYKMKSSDDGEKTLKSLVKFKKKGYYRIYVKDTYGNQDYIQFNVGNVDDDNDNIELSTNRKSPSTSQYVNLTIETDEDYTGKLTFSAKFRSSSSSSWTTISNLTSSTYFSDYSDDWDNGYYKMKSSDDGEKTLKSLVKFRKKGYYRIYVKDVYGNQSYIQFNVGNVDDDDDENEDIDGLTTSETNRIKKVYKEWDSMINQMKRYYPSLKKDTYWRMMSDGLHENIKALIDGKHGNFDDYDDFEKAFDEWYKYTTTNI